MGLLCLADLRVSLHIGRKCTMRPLLRVPIVVIRIFAALESPVVNHTHRRVVLCFELLAYQYRRCRMLALRSEKFVDFAKNRRYLQDVGGRHTCIDGMKVWIIEVWTWQ